jgi:hypothetical protein
MTRPTLERLEVMAIQNQLDVIVWTTIKDSKESKLQYERRKDLLDRYKALTGEDYVYQDVRRNIID